MDTKLFPQTVSYVSFSSKFIWNRLYLVISLLFIWNHLQKNFLQLERHIELLAHQ